MPVIMQPETLCEYRIVTHKNQAAEFLTDKIEKWLDLFE